MVHLYNYKSAAQESHLDVSYDGFFMNGFPTGEMEWLQSGLSGIFNALSADFPGMEEIVVGGIVSSTGNGEISFRAFDILVVMDVGSAYLAMSSAKAMFSDFGIPYYGAV